MTTSAPHLANASTIALPSPRLPPVTTTTLSAKSVSWSSGVVIEQLLSGYRKIQV
jgi:hypothetical protein